MSVLPLRESITKGALVKAWQEVAQQSLPEDLEHLIWQFAQMPYGVLPIRSQRRIMREYRDHLESESIGAFSSWYELDCLRYDDLKKWRGVVFGPPGTPYEGGIFAVDLTVDYNYPMRPPEAKFVTKIHHPRVSDRTGAISCGILHPNSWSPIHKLTSVLIEIRTMMIEAYLLDSRTERNRDEFENTATRWTHKYAQKGFLEYF